MSTPARVIVFDTTLRDGEQAPGFSLDVPSKLAMARALDGLGVDIIEAGFPIASPADSEAVRRLAPAESAGGAIGKPASRSRRRPIPRRCGRSRPRSGGR